MIRSFSRMAAIATSAAVFLFASPVFAKPTISAVTPATATAGTPVTFSAAVSSAVPIQSCNLYVDLEDKGEMTVAGNTASKSYTFPYGGARIAFVFCRDTGGGLNSGPNTSIWVEGPLQNAAPLSTSEPTTEEPSVTEAPTTAEPAVQAPSDQLVKLICSEAADANDPCRAVYYVDSEGRRHAFPNERIYFSWYADFNDVTEISSEEIASFTLGENVAYRPGTRLVKFRTDPKVYAVDARGELRWVKTEEVATELYGADWNTKVDDIPDAFYTDYSFGTEIESATEFSPSAAMEGSSSIEENLR